MKEKDYLERRNFFRVDDQAIVRYQVITREEKDEGISRLKSNQLEMPDISRLYFTLETEFQDMLAKMKDIHVKSALEILNRKINLLTKGGVVNSQYNTLFTQTGEPVSLSASGIGFMSEEPLDAGSHCQIELVLLPEKSYLFGYGHVKNCFEMHSSADERPFDNGKSHRLGLVFDYMREEDMERLIQHIMRVEARLIRQARAFK